MITEEQKRQAAFWLTSASAATILLSIAASQILLGLALVALLWSRQKWELPPFKLPLALFVAGTFLAILASGHIRAGFPQAKKFYVFLLLVAVYTTFRSTSQLRRLTLVWAGIATLAAGVSAVQFGLKVMQARKLHEDFYLYYIGSRTTGFMSHWMTFSGEQMIVLMLTLALLFFAIHGRSTPWLWVAAALLVASLVISYTRNAWLGALAGGVYLIWRWRPPVLLAVPIALALVVLFAPPVLRERIQSFVKPQGDTDSNRHRIYTFFTGLRMVEAHPLLGLGPEEIGPEFDHYLPPDLPKNKPVGYYGHLHNIYLQYAAERGIPTLLFLLWLIGKAAYDFSRAARRPETPPNARFFLYGAVGTIIAVLIAGFFEYNLGDSEVLMLFLCILAGGYVAIREQQGSAYVQ